MLKVLFQSRRTLFSVPGGDTVQILRTAEALRRLGLTVEVDATGEASPRGFDLVHLFNLMRPQEVWSAARKAHDYGLPIALSTIYGPYVEFDRNRRSGLPGLLARLLPHSTFESVKILGRLVVNGERHPGVWRMLYRGYRNAQMDILRWTSVLLPNSEPEGQRVFADFSVANSCHVQVVPNAMDPVVFHPEHHCPNCERVRATHGEGFVLCVARIEGRKCQLALAQALADTSHRLVLVGKPGPNSQAYFDQLKTLALGGLACDLVGQVDPDQLPCYYRAAGVHALVSWMETPGLSSLEAAAMGIPIVVTGKGDTRAYFGDEANYCEPEDVVSIAQALREARCGYGRAARLMTRVRSQYTWDAAAAATLKGYEAALMFRETPPNLQSSLS